MGPALPAIVTVERLAGRVGTVEIVDDPENLKGRLYKKRRQTSARRQVDWSVVGKCDEIVMLERRAQTFPVGRGAVNEDRPEALWLGRLGKRGEGRLQHHRLLARNCKERRHEGIAVRDRQDREMDLRHRHDVEEIRWLGDRQLATSWQCVDAGKIG